MHRRRAPVDNTFGVWRTGGGGSVGSVGAAHLVACADFARQDQRQRSVHQFELENHRRLVRRQAGGINMTPRYSAGNSTFCSRPVTGVDMALGLNGYQSALASAAAAATSRTPSTLRRLDDDGDTGSTGSGRAKSALNDEDRLRQLRQQLRELKEKEHERRNKHVHNMKEKQLVENSQDLREERTRLLNKAGPNDWKYQVEFKHRREGEAVQADKVHAFNVAREVEDEGRIQTNQIMVKRAQYVQERRNDLAENVSLREEAAAAETRRLQLEYVEDLHAAEQERLQQQQERADLENRRAAIKVEQRIQTDEEAAKAESMRQGQLAHESLINEENAKVLEEMKRTADLRRNTTASAIRNYESVLADLSAKETAQEKYVDAFVSAQADVVAAHDAGRRMELAVARRSLREDAHNGVVKQLSVRAGAEAAAAQASAGALLERLEAEAKAAAAVDAQHDAERKARLEYRHALEEQIRQLEGRRRQAHVDQRRADEEAVAFQNAADAHMRRKVAALSMLESHIAL